MNRPRLLLASLALTASFFNLTPAHATSVIAPEFDTLVNQADYIVRARVKAVDSERQDHEGQPRIITHVTLEVKEVIAGNPPSPLVLRMLGGRVGDEELIVEGAPKFHVGDEDVLFIRNNGRAFSPLVAVMHGRYPIHRDSKSGRDAVLRSNGVPLYDRSEVSLPMTNLSKTVMKKFNTAAPLQPAEFIAQIRQSRIAK